MARQAGPFYFTGTIGDVVFYKLGGNYYMRMKGDYNTKALQKPGARPLMQLKQQEFGKASKLASQVYRTLPRARRGWGVHSRLTQMARKLLQQRKTEAEVLAQLLPLYLKETPAEKQEAPIADVPCPPVEKQKVEEPVVAKKQVAKARKPKAANTLLSAWQVSAGGRLNRSSTTVVPNQPGKSMSNEVSCCAPCRFSGFPTSVRDGSE